MKDASETIVAGPGQHTVAGSHGTLLVDDVTGEVRKYVPSDQENAYQDIVRFDVREYCEYNGGMDDTDIVLIGFWTEDGDYHPPDFDERDRRGVAVTLREKQRRDVTPQEKAAKAVALMRKK